MIARAVTVGAVLAGTAIRMEQYMTRRALWFDESSVGLNIVHRSYAGLLHPLDYNQGAPILWLWTERTLALVLGENEYSLRLVALLCGIATIVVAALLGRRLFGRWGAVLCAVMAAFAPAAVRYSSEVKQYSSDLLLSTLLLLVAPVGAARSARPWVVWAAVGAFAVWFSHPAVFVLVATAAVIGLAALRDGDRSTLVALIEASAAWLTSWLVVYLVALRHLSNNAFLRSYWAYVLGPRPLTVGSTLHWLGIALSGMVADPGHLVPQSFIVNPRQVLPALAVAGVGVAMLAGLAVMGWDARRRLWAGIVVATIAMTLVAALADLYPPRARLALFLLPLFWITLTALVLLPATRQRIDQRGALAVAVVAAVAALAGPLAGTWSLARHPYDTADIRAAMQYVHAHREPGDEVWVQFPEEMDAEFYAPITATTPDHQIDDGLREGCSPSYQEPVAAAHGDRVWALFGARFSNAVPDERARLVTALASEARLVSRKDVGGAEADLFDFSSRPPGPAAVDGLSCLLVAPFVSTGGSGLHTGPFHTGRTA